MTVQELKPAAATQHDPFEHVDVGDSIRARIHFLVAQNAALNVQTQFADAKAAALMTLMGILALRGPIPISALGTDPVGMAALGLSVFSIICCLWAVVPRFSFPRLRVDGARQADHFSWTALSARGYDDVTHAAFVQDGRFPELIRALSTCNVASARVLRKKFAAMRLAFLAALAAVVALLARAVL